MNYLFDVWLDRHSNLNFSSPCFESKVLHILVAAPHYCFTKGVVNAEISRRLFMYFNHADIDTLDLILRCGKTSVITSL